MENIDFWLKRDLSKIVIYELAESKIKHSNSYEGLRITNLFAFRKEDVMGFSCENFKNDYSFKGEKLILLPFNKKQQIDFLNLKLPLCVKSFAVEDYLDFLENVSVKQAYKKAELSYLSYSQFESEADIPKCKSIFGF